MSRKKQINHLEQCPFFIRTDRVGTSWKISCESPVPGSTLMLYFRATEDFEAQRRLFCCEHYRKCEIYRATMQKYDD